MIEKSLLIEVHEELQNRLDYAKDQKRHGWKDDWKVPARTFADGYGDCEDFMMAAASLLLQRGASPNDLYFNLVNTRGDRLINHAVLAGVTDDGLRTCGDTYFPYVAPLIDVYNYDCLKEWMHLEKPGVWRKWARPD